MKTIIGIFLIVYRAITPEFIRDWMYTIRVRLALSQIRRWEPKVLDSLQNSLEPISPSEAIEIKDFINSKGLDTFPYLDLVAEDNFNILIGDDDRYCVKHNSQIIYFKKQTTRQANFNYYKGLLKEQLPNSPHRYLSDFFQISEDAIIVDVGAAEGNFSMSLVNKVKKIYIFEANPDWIEALKISFEPYKEKVEIIHKFVSNSTYGESVALDDFFEGKQPPTFIKLDVEGNEDIVLGGASNLLLSESLQVAICTYHKHGDDKKYKDFFHQRGFLTEYSLRHMLFFEDFKNWQIPYFRKGVLRAKKP